MIIAPFAITLALSFWTGATGTNPCPDGVRVDPLTPVQVAAGYDGWARFGDLCHISIGPTAASMPVARQCALVAHELGHANFSLEHQPGTIMDPATDTRPIPGACFPPRPWRPGGGQRARNIKMR